MTSFYSMPCMAMPSREFPIKTSRLFAAPAGFHSVVVNSAAGRSQSGPGARRPGTSSTTRRPQSRSGGFVAAVSRLDVAPSPSPRLIVDPPESLPTGLQGVAARTGGAVGLAAFEAAAARAVEVARMHRPDSVEFNEAVAAIEKVASETALFGSSWQLSTALDRAVQPLLQLVRRAQYRKIVKPPSDAVEQRALQLDGAHAERDALQQQVSALSSLTSVVHQQQAAKDGQLASAAAECNRLRQQLRGSSELDKLRRQHESSRSQADGDGIRYQPVGAAGHAERVEEFHRKRGVAGNLSGEQVWLDNGIYNSIQRHMPQSVRKRLSPGVLNHFSNVTNSTTPDSTTSAMAADCGPLDEHGVETDAAETRPDWSMNSKRSTTRPSKASRPGTAPGAPLPPGSPPVGGSAVKSNPRQVRQRSASRPFRRASDQDAAASLSFEWGDADFDCSAWETLTPGALTRQVAGVEVVIVRSAFEGRPPVVVFFSDDASDIHADESDEAPLRLSRLVETRCSDGAGKEGRFCMQKDGVAPLKMFYAHDTVVHEYKAVVNVLHASGFQKAGCNTKKWAMWWGSVPKPEQLREYHQHQKINHFPNAWQLGRKDYVWRNIRRMMREHAQDFSITPSSFVLPDDMRVWLNARQENPKATWIYKPSNSSCGRGIRLLRSPMDEKFEQKISQKNGVVQRYIDNPMLIRGYKFDLRVYVVVTSYDPLKVYINAEGLVRLATEKYNTSSKSLGNRTMHLTNYSVNKLSGAYIKNMDGGADANSSSPNAASVDADEDACEGDGEGCADEGEGDAGDSNTGGSSAFKWSFQQLRDHFQAEGLDYDLMMESIKDLVIKTVIAVEPTIVSGWHSGASFCGGSSDQAPKALGPNQTCFEVYGFDVLVDEALQPWLLEVNIQPSFSSSSPLDKRIKTQLMADVFTLIGLRPFDFRAVCNAAKEERTAQACGVQQKIQGSQRSHTIQSIGSCSLAELGPSEWITIMDAHDEDMRSGALELIYPTTHSVDKYASFFPSARYTNAVLSKWVKAGGAEVFLPENRHLRPPWLPEKVFHCRC